MMDIDRILELCETAIQLGLENELVLSCNDLHDLLLELKDLRSEEELDGSNRRST